MQRRTLIGALAAGAAGLGAAAFAGGPAGFRDVLDTPAQPSPLAPRVLVGGLARAGRRIVAVGQRGHVLLSDDEGRSWQQAEVPVASDLVAVHCPTPDHGWAVGHDGVVLASEDGGRRWVRRLDGRALGGLLVAHYRAAGDAAWLAEAQRIADTPAQLPLLDVWFDDAQRGFAVGAFGLLLATDDGGRRWQPLMHLADNPKALHLYAVRRIAGELCAVGEQGLLLRWEREAGRFAALKLPYGGTLFGIAGHARALVVHGLRGSLLRSTDGGRSWAAVPTGVAVGLTASTLDARERLVVVSQAGHLLRSDDDGASFVLQPFERPLPAAAVVAAGPDALLLAGPRGLQRRPLA